MTFTITKVADKNFTHFDGFKEMNFSNWEIVFNNTDNTLILQMRNGAPFPKKQVLATDVIIKNGTGGTHETFTTNAEIRARLIELGYNALVTSDPSGGEVNSVNGQTGVVVLDADDIEETATRKWQSANQDTFNDFTSSGQGQLDSKEDKVSGVTATGTDTYAITVPNVTAYSSGYKTLVKFANVNTGASTINVNGLGAKTILKNISDAVVAGDLSGVKWLMYDGTNFIVVGSVGTGGGGGTSYQYIRQFLPAVAFSVINTWYSWNLGGLITAGNPSASFGTGTLPTTSGTWYADTGVLYLKDCKNLNKMSFQTRNDGANTYQFYVVIADLVLTRGNETNGQVVVSESFTNVSTGSHQHDFTILSHSDFNANSVMYIFMRCTSGVVGAGQMQLLYKFEDL